MGKVIVLLLLIKIAIILSLAWFVDSSGVVSLTFADYHIETSLTLFSIVCLAVFIFAQLIFLTLYKIGSLPKTIGGYLDKKRSSDVLSRIKQVLLAVAAHDVKNAVKLSAGLRKLDMPVELANILYLQVAVLAKDSKKVNFATTELLQSEQTKIIGLMELMQIEGQKEDWHLVINYAEELWQFHNSEWLLQNHLQALINIDNWHDVLEMISRRQVKACLGKLRYETIEALAKFKVAELLLASHDVESAYEIAESAYRHLKNFQPLVELLASIYWQRQDAALVLKFSRSVWKQHASYKLAEVILSTAHRYSKEKFFEKVQAIVAQCPDDYESLLLFGKAALINEQFDVAADAISKALAVSNNGRACLLMAEYCQKSHGNTGEIVEWVRRGMNNMANCDNNVYYLRLEDMLISSSALPAAIPIYVNK